MQIIIWVFQYCCDYICLGLWYLHFIIKRGEDLQTSRVIFQCAYSQLT
jgi:hypothetical protein